MRKTKIRQGDAVVVSSALDTTIYVVRSITNNSAYLQYKYKGKATIYSGGDPYPISMLAAASKAQLKYQETTYETSI